MVTHFCPFDFSPLIAPLERNRHALLTFITSVLTFLSVLCYNEKKRYRRILYANL